jgi:carbon starvation protein
MGKARWCWVTLTTLAWLLAVTLTASIEKVWHPDPRLGFLAHARYLSGQLAAGGMEVAQVADTHRLIFNDRLDATVTAGLMLLMIVILAESGCHWWFYVSGKVEPVLKEAPVELSRILD